MTARVIEEPKPGALRIVEGPRDERPEIRVDYELSDVTDYAAQALSLDGEIYQRGGALVHVVVPTATAPGAKSLPLIRELPLATLRVRLAQVARWIKFDSKKERWGRIVVPDTIVAAIHSRGQWADVRPLIGVVTAPTIRPDGSLLQTAGYDDQTQLLYWPDEEYMRIDDDQHLTREDARGAADSILDLVCDFPFDTAPDRSVWLAAVLTLVGRIAISGVCPLFAFDANTRGSGKSLLVDAASMLAYGARAPRSSMSLVDEEMRKQITTMLISGSPCALLDNVKSGGKFGGPAFDALLTSEEWRERDLGKLKSLRLPARTVWFVTGNNLRFVGDLSRRTLRSRLMSPLEDPENREDLKHGKGDAFLDLIKSRRKRLVTQCLIILRAHALAGRPSSGGTWGSFESWSRIIVDAIRWMGLPDPMLARVTFDPFGDDDGTHIRSLIAALSAIGRPVLTRELVTILYPPLHYGEPEAVDADPSFGPARDALQAGMTGTANRSGVPSPDQVGIFLRRIRGRVVGGRSIANSTDPHSKLAVWSVKGAAS